MHTIYPWHLVTLSRTHRGSCSFSSSSPFPSSPCSQRFLTPAISSSLTISSYCPVSTVWLLVAFQWAGGNCYIVITLKLWINTCMQYPTTRVTNTHNEHYNLRRNTAAIQRTPAALLPWQPVARVLMPWQHQLLLYDAYCCRSIKYNAGYFRIVDTPRACQQNSCCCCCFLHH